MSAKPIRMLCIGEPLIESVATLQADGPLTDEKPTGFAGDIAPNFAAYAKMAATQLGVDDCKIDVLTGVGGTNDDVSNRALADLQSRGLGIHPNTRRIEGKTLGRVINLKAPDSGVPDEKVRLDRKDSAFRDWLNDASDNDLHDMARNYTHIVVSGIPLACTREREKLVRLLQLAKNEKHVKIIVSTNLRPSNWQMPDNEHPDGLEKDDDAWKDKARGWLNRIIPLANILFANQADEHAIRQTKSSEDSAHNLRLLNRHAEIVVTDDDKPIQLRCFNGAGGYAKATVDAHQAQNLVDTVGAGDALAATYVMAREAGYKPTNAVRLGTYVASQVVGFDGALPPADATPPSFALTGIRPEPHAAAVSRLG